MPLVGLLLFLRRCSDWYRSYYVGVSMPLVGLLLFLLELCSTEINRKVDVSMPLVGLLLFLPLLYFIYMRKMMCVNALSRASLISTVPSGNPHKYWLPSLIFAGICLTILKTRFFRSFFGMLILL